MHNVDFHGISVSAGSLLPVSSTEGIQKDWEVAKPIC